MRQITISRRKTVDGRTESWQETYRYYTVPEARYYNLPYHTEWRSAIHEDLKPGDFVLTEEPDPEVGVLEVIPVIRIDHWYVGPILRTPTGSFNPKNKFKLTAKKMFNRWSFSEKSPRERQRKNLGTAKEVFQASMVKAAWYFARTGDNIGAYRFAYCHTRFYKKLTEPQIRRHANRMLAKPVFIFSLMNELAKHWDQAGITPAELMKNIAEKIKDPDADFENVMEGTKFLMALHPEFKAAILQLMPEIPHIQAMTQQRLPPQTYEAVEFTEMQDAHIQPGKHLKELNPQEDNGTNATEDEPDTVEKVLPRLPDEPVVASEEDRSA